MRGEEGLARGLELARLAEKLGGRRAAGLGLEVERLGKALFACRAQLAGSEARGQGLRRELERAAEIIAASSAAVAAGGEGGGGEGRGGGEIVATAAADGGLRAARQPSYSSEHSCGGLTEDDTLWIRNRRASSAPSAAGDKEPGVDGIRARADSGSKNDPLAAGRLSNVALGVVSETGTSLHPGGGSSAIAGYDVEL